LKVHLMMIVIDRRYLKMIGIIIPMNFIRSRYEIMLLVFIGYRYYRIQSNIIIWSEFYEVKNM